MKVCRVCGWRKAKRKGRCDADNQFFRRHGRDRSAAEVMVSYERTLDRIDRVLMNPQVAKANNMRVTP